MLGSELSRCAPPGAEITSVDIDEVDVVDRVQVFELVERTAPEIILNASAFTAVDLAEEKVDDAYRVNGLGPQNLALAAKERGARLLHVSTDFVFDGTREEPYYEYDPPNPLGVYGRSKYWGECLAREAGGDVQIVRTQWLYGPRGKHFVGAILRAAGERPELRVVEDQIGCPTLSTDLAGAMWKIALEGDPGTWHCSNRGECSWYEFALAVLEIAGKDVPVVPISSTELERPAPRPAYSVLSCPRLELGLGVIMREWREALAAYLSDAGELEFLCKGS
jgi:dTDP-4-dehydrorhamnose reductase